MRFKLKLYFKGEMVKDTDSSKYQVISHYIRTLKWDKGYLKISYGNGHYNDGWYTDLKEMKKVLSEFTEKPLVEYLQVNPPM